MDTIIEVQRKTHEEIERLEQAIVKEFADKPKTVSRVSDVLRGSGGGLWLTVRC
jgi:hypothetical protein